MDQELVSNANEMDTSAVQLASEEPITEADKAYIHFVGALPRIRELRSKLSLRALSRVFDAIITFPYDEQSISKIKKSECDENELFLTTLGALGAKKIVDHAMVKFKAEETAVNELVDKVKEANKQSTTKGVEDGN